MRERFKLEEGWSTLALLIAMMIAVSRVLAAAEWTAGLDSTLLIGVLAVFTGLALARTRWTGWGTLPFVAGYGIFLIGWLNGRQLEGFLTWQARINNLAARVWDFLVKAFSGGTSRDPLMFVVFVMAITWLIGLFAAWSVFRRKQVWPAVIPAGAALFINVYYYLGPNNLQVYLLAYLLILLLLVARMHLYRQEVKWRAARVAFNPELRLDFLRASVLAAILVLSLAWIAPSASASPAVLTAWSRLTGPWSEVRESWNRLFSSLKSYGQQAIFDYYGDSLVLAGPITNSDRPIMDVAATPLSAGRYYWRARVFDYYEDGRWQTSESERVEVNPDEEALAFTPYQGRSEVQLKFTSFVPASRVLYVAPGPEWVDRPVNYELTYSQTGTADITVVRSQKILRQGESYAELALVTHVDAGSLRQAGRDYPLWVQSRYLQIPPELTNRTRELAADIMAGYPTPYDKALAVTVWLRDNIEYDDQRPSPPPGVEPIDHLLFEIRQGYCYYYASAMVMMLRSQGIPARVAVGFAQGEHLADQGIYRVRERDAHAWPEVYFPDFGWVEFEPTVSQLPLVRPQSAADPLLGGENAEDPQGLPADPGGLDEGLLDLSERDIAAGAALAESRAAFWRRVALFGGAALILLAGLAAVWWALEYGGLKLNPGKLVLSAVAQRLSRAGVAVPLRLAAYADRPDSGLSPTALAYGRLVRALRWLGFIQKASATPYERIEAFQSALPAGREPAQAIAEEYVQEIYANRPGDETTARDAWSSLRLAVWLKALRRKFGGS